MSDTWVPVAERLPPVGVYVLVFGVEPRTYGRQNQHVAYIDDDDGSDADLACWMLECGMKLINVTHWMPLPKLP